jgi:TRAP-type C4-dicarboxylate transport system permease large subunit
MLSSIFAVLWAATWSLYAIIITSKGVNGGVETQAEWVVVCVVSILCLCIGFAALVVL